MTIEAGQIYRSCDPRGERAGTPGANWERQLVRTEVVVEDAGDTTVHGMNDPQPPNPNRATRRAMARAARRKK
ncbi:hypothetical protein ACF1BS_03535 [Streptomyces sp. NPDC014748]|uniref:hypothetical protein n=1 Tax=Streptomyces sp. NPDC014748 TaxID=3364905 RepID=UPI0036F94CC0